MGPYASPSRERGARTCGLAKVLESRGACASDHTWVRMAGGTPSPPSRLTQRHPPKYLRMQPESKSSRVCRLLGTTDPEPPVTGLINSRPSSGHRGQSENLYGLMLAGQMAGHLAAKVAHSGCVKDGLPCHLLRWLGHRVVAPVSVRSAVEMPPSAGCGRLQMAGHLPTVPRPWAMAPGAHQCYLLGWLRQTSMKCRRLRARQD
jgi:hypothetical protein